MTAVSSGSIGVAISTTGDEHRLRFLQTCVSRWRGVLPLGSALVVTVDGDAAATRRVYEIYDSSRFGNVYRVGQGGPTRDGRQGVAINKNTGIELLMEQGVRHLFLCDDDTAPFGIEALYTHMAMERVIPHSMVCWGHHRHPTLASRDGQPYAVWSWPRGVMLYTHRRVIENVGGMIEAFGPGGHEHVEFSRRIHQAGHTPDMYCTPSAYASDLGRGARRVWDCEDMQKQGEPLGNTRRRRQNLTSVRRRDGDWEHIVKIMEERDGDPAFVPYTAHENGRESATLCTDLVSAEEPNDQ